VTDDRKKDAFVSVAHAVTDVAAAGAPVPARIAHFRITGALGQGGMGVVYRAEDETLRRTVALKLLPDAAGSEERRQRFLREARSAAAITHPNVATVYQVGEADGRVYIAMELVDGENLRERMRRGRLDLATARDLATQIARGLAAAHDKGIVHRDLKPENVMIGRSGVVKLLDFGLAKAGVETPAAGMAQAALARTATVVTSDASRVMGTPEYMSPEQATGEPLDVRSDVFSFGIVLYEMLAGARPFDRATTGGVLVAVARDAPPPLRDRAPDVDLATEQVVARCLAKAPGERFRSAGELVAALSDPTSPRATTVSRTDVAPLTHSGTVARPTSTRAAMLALALVCVAGAGALAIASRSAAPAGAPVAPATAAPSAPASAPAASAAPSDGISRSSSSEAQRYYDEAMRSFHDGTGQTVPLLQSAVKADPGFGAAYLWLWWLSNTIYGTEVAEHSDEYHRRLVALQAALTPRERALLDALEQPDGKSEGDKLDAYLAQYPDDDLGWTMRGTLDRTLATNDRSLPLHPTLVPLLVQKANRLVWASRDDEAAAVLGHCLEISPYSTACLFSRSTWRDDRGKCVEAEEDLRRWLELQPDSRTARLTLAGVLAAEGTPAAALREVLAGTTYSTGGTGAVVEALVPMFDGDLVEVERVATAASTKLPSSATESEHFEAASTLVDAYSESGDPHAAARVATDYLARRAAWQSLSPTMMVIMTAVAARGGRVDASVANRRREEAFQAFLAQKAEPGVAWVRAYAQSSDTPDEARAAVARLDSLQATLPSPSTAAAARTLFLAGRTTEARPLLEQQALSCSSTLLDTRDWVRSHLYLGELDEQAGNRTSACAHYAKVLARWGHAKPRSVTADEARAHAAKLGCSAP
jgi:serine/threonine-protein kinase